MLVLMLAYRTTLLFVFAFLLGVSYAQDSTTVPVQPTVIQFQGVLSDPEFVGKDSIRAELLETGESQGILHGKVFSFTLPLDTLWNICITAPGMEKCYSLKYLGKDFRFSLDLTGDQLVTWFSDSTLVAQPVLPDSVAADSTDTLDIAGLISTEERATELRKVVVQLRKKPRRRLGESVVSSKQIKRLPGLAEADVIRSLQALPGVVASSDFSTKIYVRGGGADQNLFLFDNAVVFSPVHFFGLFSTFLVEGVDEVKFYKSGFAPYYGNRLSSVVDIRSRQGGTDSTEAWFDKSSVKVSTFATQIHTEGHQGDTRWLFAGRTTYIKEVLDFMYYLDAIDFKLNYRFTDLQGNVTQSLGEDRSVGISFYTGKDVLDFDPVMLDWGNTVIPLNFKWRLNDDLMYQSTLAYSQFSQTFGLRDLFSVYNDIQTIAFKQSLTNRGIWEEHELTAGYDIEYDKVNFTQDLEAFDQKWVDTTTLLMHSLFAQDTWRPESWELAYGLRMTYQDLAEYFALEPRFSWQYRFPNDHIVNGHVGYYQQFLNSILFSDQETLNEFYYPSRKATNRTIKPTTSLLTSLGYTKEGLWEDYTFNAEVYYKTQNHLVVFDVASEQTEGINSLADFFKEGSGYSFGYELSMRKNAGVLAGGVNWSQGWSVIKEQFDTVPYYPDWHQPYSLKGDLNINWHGADGIWPAPGPGRYVRSSVQLKYASGLPYTEYLGYQNTWDIDQSDGETPGGPSSEFQENTAVRLGNRNTSLQEPYFRVDIKAIDIGKENKWNFSWTILNVTNHVNIFLKSYDTTQNPPKENSITQFPFFPVLLNYEYYF